MGVILTREQGPFATFIVGIVGSVVFLLRRNARCEDWRVREYVGVMRKGISGGQFLGLPPFEGLEDMEDLKGCNGNLRFWGFGFGLAGGIMRPCVQDPM